MNKFFMVLIATAILFGLISCKGIDAESYDKLEVGMEYDQVTAILGKPDSCSAVLNMKNCIWSDGEQEIRIKFGADLVVFTSSRGLGQ